MRALEMVADVDREHQLRLDLPISVKSDRVRVLVLVPESNEEEMETGWLRGMAREWAAELGDEREDLYTLEDGEPIHAAR